MAVELQYTIQYTRGKAPPQKQKDKKTKDKKKTDKKKENKKINKIK